VTGTSSLALAYATRVWKCRSPFPQEFRTDRGYDNLETGAANLAQNCQRWYNKGIIILRATPTHTPSVRFVLRFNQPQGERTMRRIGIGLMFACLLLLAFSGVAAAQGPQAYGWPGYTYPDPWYSAGYYTGYGHGYSVGYQHGYSAGSWPGYSGWHGGIAYTFPVYQPYPTYAGTTFLRFGGGYTQGGDQGPYLRFGGGYIIDRAHSWGMTGW
jgi:hypothetical protein